MPFEEIESGDALKNMIRLQTSAVYELMAGLQTLLQTQRHAQWVRATRAALAPDLLAELSAVYEPFHRGGVFYELAVDYPDHADVPGMTEYVCNLAPVDFVFYLVGRVLTRAELAATGLKPDAVRAALQSQVGLHYHGGFDQMPLDSVLADVPAFQARLAALWRRFWDEHLAGELDALQARWQIGLEDKQRLLARVDGRTFYERVTGKTDLPMPLPPGEPVREIVCVPVYHIVPHVLMTYGYGNVTVLFDSEHTEARQAQIEQEQERALLVARALADGTRLTILRLIAQSEGMLHGKKLAARLNLSPSAVSRQLAQLRDAGLIVEGPGEGQVVTYRLRREALENFSQQLIDLLYG